MTASKNENYTAAFNFSLCFKLSQNFKIILNSKSIYIEIYVLRYHIGLVTDTNVRLISVFYYCDKYLVNCDIIRTESFCLYSSSTLLIIDFY